MSDLCNDNRFKLIEKYKKKLIESTNIESSQDEMKVLDNILFRFWQMEWLDKLELPSVQPTYTDAEIQKMQDLESAQIEKAYQLGYEEGKKDAQTERKKGKWINLKNKNGTILALRCSVCDNSPKHAIRSDYCPSCGADMRGKQDE